MKHREPCVTCSLCNCNRVVTLLQDNNKVSTSHKGHVNDLNIVIIVTHYDLFIYYFFFGDVQGTRKW